MPIYEYRCGHCQKHFERLLSFRQAGEQVLCPHCGAAETHKQFSTFATTERAASTSTAPSRCLPSSGG